VVSETKKSNDELLEEALENEDYEEAAKIRDKIKNKK
jgi:protein-arginine kinase activator protein McsA